MAHVLGALIDMNWSRLLLTSWLALWVMACGRPASHLSLANPLAPSASTPAPAPPIYVPPPPRQFPAFEITTIAVPDVIVRTNRDAPECLGEPGWPCIYFRVVAPSTGTLEVALSYAWGTQGNQGVDVTLNELNQYQYVWAQTFVTTGPRWHTAVTAPVLEGKSYDITLWYTFPNLSYELRAAMR